MPVPIPNLQQLQINPPQPATMRMQGMQMQNQLEQLGIAKDRNAIAREGMDLEREGFEFNKMKQNLMLGKEHLPTLQKSEYGKYRKWVESIGAPVQFLPTEEAVSKMSNEQFSDLKLRMIMGSDNIGKMALEDYKNTISQSNAQQKRQQDMEDFKEKEDYKQRYANEKAPTEAELTQRAARGDKEAQFLLNAMNEQARKKTEVQTQGKVQGLLEQMGGPEGVAKAIVEGREDWGKIKNTFGVPMIEMIRKEVLKQDAKFDFIVPTAVFKTLTSSLGNQEKQRGMMQSFVANINAQVNRVDEIMADIDRWGIRGLDLPKRELKKRLIGSGHEVTLEAYLTEISNEIGKLSTGSQASIRELSTEGQARWNKIHDPNLSLKEMKIILDETKNMAAMRMKTVDDTIELTKERMRNVMKPDRTSSVDINLPAGSNFEILSVED